MRCPQRVLVFGGTHGNEWTGIMAVTHYHAPLRQKYQDLELQFVLANPEAYKINRRFKDEDLNRAFQFLQEDRKNSFEHGRALELRSLITSSPCFVIDLHTTTANMGTTVIVSHVNRVNLHVCRKLKEAVPDCRVIVSPDPSRKYLASQSDFGLMIEVGPIANGTVHSVILEKTVEVLDNVLAAISENETDRGGEIEVFEEVEDIFYPLNEKGEISAAIHPDLQGGDFTLLHGDYRAFRTFRGEDITLSTREELYPIFINEAAYYPQKLAFTLCKKINNPY